MDLQRNMAQPPATKEQEQQNRLSTHEHLCLMPLRYELSSKEVYHHLTWTGRTGRKLTYRILPGGDARDYDAVFKACEGIDCVFHVAACGISGLEQVNIQWRQFNFKFGNHKVQMNWVHVGNLIQAHLLAFEALTSVKGYVAVGKQYQHFVPAALALK